MEDKLAIELDSFRIRSLSFNISIEQISNHLDFVPKLKPKKSMMIPSPMRLNKKDKLSISRKKIPQQAQTKSIFLEDEYLKLAKLDTYYSHQEDEEIESDSTGEIYPNKFFRNELHAFKEHDVKTQNVFPRVETVCPFKKSKLSKAIGKEYLQEEDEEVVESIRRINSVKGTSKEVTSTVTRRSSSILFFLANRKSTDNAVFN